MDEDFIGRRRIPRVLDYRDYLYTPKTKYDKACVACVKVNTYAVKRTEDGWGVFKVDKVCSDRDRLYGVFATEGLAERAVRRLLRCFSGEES